MEIGANYVVKTQKHAKQKKKTDFQIFPQKNMKFIIFFLKIVRFVFYK